MTAAGELLEELQGLGVALTATTDGERLHWKAKKGVLTDALREALTRHKASLLDLLPPVDRELRLRELQSTDYALSAISALSPPASELREPRSTDKTDKTPVTVSTQRVSHSGSGALVDRQLRNQTRDLVARLHTLGVLLKWPELPIKTGVTIKAGEDAWTKFLRYPPPGALQAALEAAKSKIEQEYPF